MAEPERIGDGEALEAFLNRMQRLGIEPDENVEVGPSHSETPEQARERIEQAVARRGARWWSRVPEDYRAASLDDLDEQPRVDVERWLADDRALTLVLAGGVGLGKTHAGYAVGNHLMERGGIWCEAYKVYDLLVDLRPDGDPYTLDRVTNCGFLLLDDLGATKASPWAVETLTFIVDQRVSNRRRTVVTTNVSEPELRQVWEDRLIDRLRDRSVVHLFRGESRRRRAW